MILEARDLLIGYPNSFQLKEALSFQLNQHEILHIQGRNGSGKTTLIQTLLGNLHPISGDVIQHVFPLRYSYLPQIRNDSILPYRNSELLEIFNVSSSLKDMVSKELKKQTWSKSSGGQKQFILTLIKLSENKEVLILDEPFNHLDKPSIEKLCDLIEENLSSQKIKALILVSHSSVKFKRSRTHQVVLQ